MTRMLTAPASLTAPFAPLAFIASVFLPTLLTGCFAEENRGCTLDARFNFCITVRGSDSIPDSLLFIRERLINSRTGETHKDTLRFPSDRNCFGEHSGKQRLFVHYRDSLIHQTEWIRVDEVDGCHAADTTIDLLL